MNIQQRIAELEAELTRLKEEEQNKRGFWKPNSRCSYYTIGAGLAWLNDNEDKRNLLLGDCHPTREAANRFKAKMELLLEMREFGGDYGEWSVFCTPDIKEWGTTRIITNFPKFPSPELAQEALKKFADRLYLLL